MVLFYCKNNEHVTLCLKNRFYGDESALNELIEEVCHVMKKFHPLILATIVSLDLFISNLEQNK